jgi:hypothetical protein
MDSTIITNQFNQFKINLIADIKRQIHELDADRIYFTNTFFYIQPNNPDQVFSVYGIENETLLIDTFFEGFTTFKFEELSFECLIFIKTELEYFQNSKIISQNFNN